MMKLIYAVIAIQIYSSFCFGQNTIEQLVLEKVNHLRDSLHLKPLQQDAVLYKAGEDQAYYIASKSKLTHFQSTYTKETPADRVFYYKGNRTYVGENVAQITTKLINKTELDIADAAEQLYDAWLHSPKHYENMIHPNFTKMGLGIRIVLKNKLYGAQVFSSDEIHLPSAFKNSNLSWGVRSAEKTCKDELQTYETMSFANSILVEGNSVYFYFQDRDFFNQVFRNDNDGMAIDVILRDQLPCNKENQFHISPVFDGEMQRPVYRSDLYRNNESENPKKIKVKLGEIPNYLQKSQWEANIIIIKNNKLCDYSYPVKVPSGIFPLLKIKPYYDTDDTLFTKSSSDRFLKIKEEIHLVLNFDRGDKDFWSDNIEEIRQLQRWGSFVKSIEINCFASVEGPLWLNQQLLEKRKSTIIKDLESLNIDTQKTNFTLAENWALMKNQIERHSLKNLKFKTNEEVKYSLKHYPFSGADSLLFEQRKTHIYAVIDTVLKLDNYPNYLFSSFYDSTLQFKQLPWNKILRENYILKDVSIASYLVDSLVSFKQLKTNLLGAVSIDFSYSNLDSSIVQKLVNNIDIKKSKQVFNYAQFLTHYWFSHFSLYFDTKKIANTITPDELKIMVDKLDTLVIQPKDIARLKLNILLSGIHYYVAYNQWELVKSYFKSIVDIVKMEDLNPQEALELALFCNHFYKFEEAVKILHPFHENHTLSEDGYFALAQTASLITQKIEKEVYWSYMNSAKRKNHRRYCLWLDDAFQIQRDEYIKKDFCSECK